MLPDAQNAPTVRSQCSRDELVPRMVRLEFLPPEGCVVLGLRRVLRTAMPETAVHEDRKAKLGENEIRFAEYRLIATPTSDAMRAEKFC